ncbi:MAG: SAM-dependent methyltransferase [Chthoniobacterales bacterium]
MSIAMENFERLHQRNEDPWGFRTRWYERRKRDLLTASLPRERFASGWEMGCSNGELAAALAPRCDRLLVSDCSARAVVLAAERLADEPNAAVEQRELPGDWPEERFDLIVMSEIGYFLSEADLECVVMKLRDSLTAEGVLIACHWRGPIEGYEIDGDETHATLRHNLPWRVILEHVEDDFLMEGWSVDGVSVAKLEGLK